MSSEEYFERVIHFDNPQFNISTSTSIDSIRILQKYDSDESGVVWDASLMLAKYLEHVRSINCNKSFSNLSVVELGSGTGFLGIWMATLGSSVLLTDLNLTLIELNLKHNKEIVCCDYVQTAIFDWLDRTSYQTDKFLNWKPLKHIDLFLISDCLYYKEGIDAIYQFIQWVLIDCRMDCQFLVSYEDRDDKAEMVQNFLELLANNKYLEVTTIVNDQLHPEFRSPDLHIIKIIHC